MIHTNRIVTVGEQESVIDRPIVLYRGDREVEIEFTLVGNEFMFSTEGNVIKSTNASHGQLVLNTPSGENMFSALAECHEGKVVFIVTKEMIDELIETGFYSFQVRLYDSEEMRSRVTIPPVMNGFDIRNPIAAEDETNVVDVGLVDYSRIVKDQSNEELPTFDWNGNYNKTEWEHHDVITENKMNKIEDAIYSFNDKLLNSDMTYMKKIKDMETKHQNDVNSLNTKDKQLGDEIDDVNRTINNRIDKLEVDVNVGDVAWKNEVEERVIGGLAKIEKQEYVNVSRFGAIGDCNTGDWFTLPSGTDDTQAIQDAFDYASEHGLTLVFEKKKYLITDTLVFDKPCNIDFNNATIVPFICEFNKPSILCSSQTRRKWANLTISGCGMIQNGIQFTKPDNQAMLIENIKIYGCRHGVYLNEAECINRAIFYNCDFGSNLVAGIYFKSYESTWGHSAPVRFEKVICNSNGVPDWMVQSQPLYNGINPLKDVNYGYQVYFKGFTLLSWHGGQISNHGNHRVKSAAEFININGLDFTGDVEDFDRLVDLNGNDVDINTNTDITVGHIIRLEAVNTSKIDVLCGYNLNGKCVVSLMYPIGDHHITVAGKYYTIYDCALYSVGSDDVRIYYYGNLCRVNGDCLAYMQNIQPYKSIRCQNFIPKQVKSDNFDNVVIDSDMYRINPFGIDTLDNNNYFNIYGISDIKKIFIKMLVSANSYDPPGRIFVSFYNSDDEYIVHQLYSPRGQSKRYSYFICTHLIDVPVNATSCKIGLCNKDNYKGSIDMHCMDPKRFEVYLLKENY